jgi:putative tricarboxylic transport membrane protein
MSNPTNPRLKLNNSELWGGLIGLALGIFVIRSGIKLKSTIPAPAMCCSIPAS